MNGIGCSQATPSASAGVAQPSICRATGSSWINQVERWFGFLTDLAIP
jgi:hypothetical protein